MQACLCAGKATIWQLLSDNRLIPSRRSVTPISRGNANALGSPCPGAFCFGVRRRCACIEPPCRNSLRPEASGSCSRGRGTAADRRMCAASRCFGAGCVRIGFHTNRVFTTRTYARLATAGHTEHQPQGLSAARVPKTRPVRAALPAAYAGACGEMFRDDVGSVVERQRKLQVAGSNPARQPLDSSDG